MKHLFLLFHDSGLQLKGLCAALIILFVLPQPGLSNDRDPPVTRILFIGNSYTSFNHGLQNHLLALAQAAAQSADSRLGEVETGSVTFGGYTLEAHWSNPATIRAIVDSDWDVVVLQEQSTRPVEDPERMFEYARLLDSVIRGSASRTMFFMTWARQDDPPMIEPLATAYTTIGRELQSEVTPVGRAFQLALAEDPEISLYDLDGSHPSHLGTYLAACCFYAVLWRRNPLGNSYPGNPEIPPDIRRFLQSIAWLATTTYRRGLPAFADPGMICRTGNEP